MRQARFGSEGFETPSHARVGVKAKANICQGLHCSIACFHPNECIACITGPWSGSGACRCSSSPSPSPNSSTRSGPTGH